MNEKGIKQETKYTKTRTVKKQSILTEKTRRQPPFSKGFPNRSMWEAHLRFAAS